MLLSSNIFSSLYSKYFWRFTSSFIQKCRITSEPLTEISLHSIPWASHSNISNLMDRLSKTDASNMSVWQMCFNRVSMIQESLTSSDMASIFTSMRRAKLFDYKLLHSLQQKHLLASIISTASPKECYRLMIASSKLQIRDTQLWLPLLHRFKAVIHLLDTHLLFNCIRAVSEVYKFDEEVEELLVNKLRAFNTWTTHNVSNAIVAIDAIGRRKAADAVLSHNTLELAEQLGHQILQSVDELHHRQLLRVIIALHDIQRNAMKPIDWKLLMALTDEVMRRHRHDAATVVYPLLLLQPQLFMHSTAFHNTCISQLQFYLQTKPISMLPPLLSFLHNFQLNASTAVLSAMEKRCETEELNLFSNLLPHLLLICNQSENLSIFVRRLQWLMMQQLSNYSIEDLLTILKWSPNVFIGDANVFHEVLKMLELKADVEIRQPPLEEYKVNSPIIQHKQMVISISSYFKNFNIQSNCITNAANRYTSELKRCGVPIESTPPPPPLKPLLVYEMEGLHL